MTRALGVVLVFCIFLVSCTEKLICPAYQSAYIYDKEALRKKFSYFNDDSTPKIYTASKNKYLIAEATTYKKKTRSLQTIPMKAVQPVVPDSLKDDRMDAELNVESVERNVNDSTAVIRIDTLAAATDSVYVISKDREVRILKYNPNQRKYFVDTVGFNTEQNNYMWYLRDILVLPDAKLAMQKQETTKTAARKAQKEKKGIRGFFNKLFKKDKSKAKDTTQTVKPTEENYYDDFEGKKRDSTNVDGSAQQPKVQEQPKKGMFSFLKKKEKSKSPKKPDTTPAKKEDEKDDGF